MSRRTPAERAYRAAFHAYPRRWQWRHQREALAVLLERADRRGGRVSWADAADLLGHGLAERGLAVVRSLRRLTPLAKLGLAVAVSALVVVGAEVYLDAVRGPTQAEVQAALPATAQVNTTRCPAHEPALPDPAHATEAVVHVLNHQLEPLAADRLLICRWTASHGGDPRSGVLTGQRLVTDQATIGGTRTALNSLRHSWWFNLHGWTQSGSAEASSTAPSATELVFGAGRSAVAVSLAPPGYSKFGFTSNGVLTPFDENAAVDTLTDRTVPHLLTGAPHKPR